MHNDLDEILGRIRKGITTARQILERFEPGDVAVRFKRGDDPVTEADHAVDKALRDILPREGEGWLSEETADSSERLKASDVWIVDPLDGTREFVSGIPEWCVSIGFVRDGRPVAGGIHNPITNEIMLGAVGHGVTYNGEPAQTTQIDDLRQTRVLASRSESKRGEWQRFENAPFDVVPCGSVAYKLALVAVGRFEATWTLVPKHEWDVAAGVALVLAGGGAVVSIAGEAPVFNRPDPHLKGLIATGPNLIGPVGKYLGIELSG